MKNVLGMCLNPRVLAGIALVIAAIWVLAPQFLLAALPLLLLAACPVSMALMAWTMRGDMSGRGAMASQQGTVDPEVRLRELELAQVRLQREVAQARADLERAPQPAPEPQRQQAEG